MFLFRRSPSSLLKGKSRFSLRALWQLLLGKPQLHGTNEDIADADRDKAEGQVTDMPSHELREAKDVGPSADAIAASKDGNSGSSRVAGSASAQKPYTEHQMLFHAIRQLGVFRDRPRLVLEAAVEAFTLEHYAHNRPVAHSNSLPGCL